MRRNTSSGWSLQTGSQCQHRLSCHWFKYQQVTRNLLCPADQFVDQLPQRPKKNLWSEAPGKHTKRQRQVIAIIDANSKRSLRIDNKERCNSQDRSCREILLRVLNPGSVLGHFALVGVISTLASHQNTVLPDGDGPLCNW